MRSLAFVAALLLPSVATADGVFQGVPYPGEIIDVSGDGLVAVGGTLTGPEYNPRLSVDEPWRIANGVFEYFPTILFGVVPQPVALDYDGSTVVSFLGFAQGGSAYRWDQGVGFTPLLFSGRVNQPFDVSDDGQVTVGFVQGGVGRNPAFLYPAIWVGNSFEGALPLPEIPGYFIWAGRATSVSSDGLTVTGYWEEAHPVGQGARFPWTYVRGVGFVPEPAGVLLWALVAWALPRRGLRRSY